MHGPKLLIMRFPTGPLTIRVPILVKIIDHIEKGGQKCMTAKLSTTIVITQKYNFGLDISTIDFHLK